MEVYINNVQQISNNLSEINSVLKGNLFTLQDMIKQILISQNQKDIMNSKITELENTLQQILNKDNKKILELEQEIEELKKKNNN